jgi:ketosteroid isomerase-like protein
MPEDNVEVVRRALAAFDSGDIEQVLATVQPDFEARIAPELSAEPDTYRGSAGVRRYFDSFRDAFEQIRFEIESLTDAGGSVVVGLRMTAIGKVTKIPVEQRNAGVWTVTGGKVARIETYARLEDARRAAGMEVQ